MDEDRISRLQRNTRSRSGDELLYALSDAIGGDTQGQYEIESVLARAKAGQPQVLGELPRDQVVVISMADLAILFQAVADTLSFADAVKRLGFEPVPGALRLMGWRPHDRDLKIYEAEKTSG